MSMWPELKIPHAIRNVEHTGMKHPPPQQKVLSLFSDLPYWILQPLFPTPSLLWTPGRSRSSTHRLPQGSSEPSSLSTSCAPPVILQFIDNSIYGIFKLFCLKPSRARVLYRPDWPPIPLPPNAKINRHVSPCAAISWVSYFIYLLFIYLFERVCGVWVWVWCTGLPPLSHSPCFFEAESLPKPRAHVFSSFWTGMGCPSC